MIFKLAHSVNSLTRQPLRAVILSVMLLFFYQCSDQTPDYELEFLQDQWFRVSSTDLRSDSMIIQIFDDNAEITFLKDSSFFKLGQLKWSAIQPISGDGDYSFNDWNSDSSFSNAIINIQNDSTLEVMHQQYPNAPGGYQIWQRY